MDLRLRILMVSPQFYPQVGGYERAAERLAAALVDRGHNVTVVAESRGRLPRQERMRGFRVLRLWCVHKAYLHTLTSSVSLARYLILHGRRYDVFHIHQYGPLAAITILMGKLWRRPVILKLTNSGHKGIAQTLGEGWRASILKNTHVRVDAIVALSRETAEEALAFGVPMSRIYLLPNGVDTEEFHPPTNTEKKILKEKLGLQGRKVAISVCRLEGDKNLEGLLSAWEAAKKKLSQEWVLVLLGDGSRAQYLWGLAKSLDSSESVLFKGTQSQVSEWLSASDIYVSSSNNEGLSNSLVEAMSCGLPVVVTRVSGVKELVIEPKAGIDIDVGDMNAFATALIYFGESAPCREARGRNGRRIVTDKYSISAVAKSYENLYSSLLDKDGKR